MEWPAKLANAAGERWSSAAKELEAKLNDAVLLGATRLGTALSERQHRQRRQQQQQHLRPEQQQNQGVELGPLVADAVVSFASGIGDKLSAALRGAAFHDAAALDSLEERDSHGVQRDGGENRLGFPLAALFRRSISSTILESGEFDLAPMLLQHDLVGGHHDDMADEDVPYRAKDWEPRVSNDASHSYRRGHRHRHDGHGHLHHRGLDHDVPPPHGRHDVRQMDKASLLTSSSIVASQRTDAAVKTSSIAGSSSVSTPQKSGAGNAVDEDDIWRMDDLQALDDLEDDGNSSSDSGRLSSSSRSRSRVPLQPWSPGGRQRLQQQQLEEGELDSAAASSLASGLSAGAPLTALPQQSAAGQHTAGAVSKEELGRATWLFLHTLAAQYPEKPSKALQKDVAAFMTLLPRVYPCKICGEHFKEVIRSNPPQVGSRKELENYMCRIHNVVNRSLGKPEIPCTRVSKIWGSVECEESACEL